MDDETEEVLDIPRGRPVGVKSQHKHYISRPESLEYGRPPSLRSDS
jgi:hypothetical protein